MAEDERSSIKTAALEDSIWRDIPEDTFRQHLVTLEERTNAIPIKPWTLSSKEDDTLSTANLYTLTVNEEQKLADDFAYLAAVGEGAQSVAAVCIEENTSSQSMCIRLAAADAVDTKVKIHLEEVGQLLTSSRICTCQGMTNSYINSLLTKIIELQHYKLLGRLRSCKWQKPKYLSRTHKKPLWQDLDNLIHRVQHVYPRKNHPRQGPVIQRLLCLQEMLKALENIPPGRGNELASLQEVVQDCYRFCKSQEIEHFATTLEAHGSRTPQLAAALKTLQQIEKIGAFQRIAMGMIARSQTYPSLFSRIEFEYMQPYSVQSTEIGYERWAKTIHVHAEIQLIVHYDLMSSTAGISCFKPPRTVGTSKYLCYLCFLFMSHHGRFSPNNTHGRLYDQWTIPDLAEYDDAIRQGLRDVIRQMDSDVTELANDIGPRQGKRDAWRSEPMTSRQNLLHLLPSESEVES
ncbi:MAG: hypothetical protein GOMPHAMPRED_007601 [Gomphillus americanus]|uniref:Uncharacterized protein n=1 Tax=Gomphillus americanus TaxID=1940652 RepID=A0A8H3ET97_9LECA|nr:MAG: hypothetical protein GOMPHAMPRED_007601 [Gomphillus americanus]